MTRPGEITNLSAPPAPGAAPPMAEEEIAGFVTEAEAELGRRAANLDAADPLAHFADRFVVADAETIYLDGNSLGRLPITAASGIEHVVAHEWGERLIRSWNERWWELPVEIGERVAPLIGAASGEVILSDSTSVNLYKLAAAAVRARPTRSTIVTDDLNFPADLHVLEGVAASSGGRVEVVVSDGINGPAEALAAALTNDTALLSLSSTVFKSGYTYDVAALTAQAHEVGALVLWDLSHSVGAVELALASADVDLAVGCTYKFLNGGPGAPAFLYVRRDLQEQLENPISGWWGHSDPFDFRLDFTPAPGVRRFQTGTLPILSLSAAAAGIDLVAEAGMVSIAAKGRRLVAFAEELWADRLQPLGFDWASPTDPDRRGAHAALAHPDAWRITQALIELGRVIPDFRAPDNVRLGLSPLTTSFVDLQEAIDRLATLVIEGHHEAFPDEHSAVT